MAYAMTSAKHGTFVGFALGLAFFSKDDTAGQFCVPTPDTPEKAEELRNSLVEHIDDIEIAEVRSGHWRDLEAAGLHIGDMAENELREARPAGRA